MERWKDGRMEGWKDGMKGTNGIESKDKIDSLF